MWVANISSKSSNSCDFTGLVDVKSKPPCLIRQAIQYVDSSVWRVAERLSVMYPARQKSDDLTGLVDSVAIDRPGIKDAREADGVSFVGPNITIDIKNVGIIVLKENFSIFANASALRL